MGRISVGQALGAGFRLIAREPAAFLVWCVVTFAIGIAPQVLSLGVSLRMLGALAAGGDPTSPEVLAAQQQVMAYQPLIYLTSLAMIALVPSAVFRAVLRPDDRAFLYLRLGGREFWLAVVVVVMFVMYFIAILAGMIPFAIVIAVTAVATGDGGGGAGAAAIGGLLGALLVLVLIAVVVWGFLRFSFAPVMAFADGTFRLFESWTLTRGRVGAMFVIGLALTVLSTVFYLAVVAVLLAVSGLDLATLGATMSAGPDALLARISPAWLAMAIVVVTLLTTAYYVVWSAAWADMYRQLRPPVAETFD